LWLLLVFWIATIGEAQGVATGLDTVVLTLCSVALVPLLLVLGYRWFTERVLWKVRNRLILTYLLMGLAPVVLVGTLAGIADYVLAGQYATDTALSLVNEASNRIRDEAAGVAAFGVQKGLAQARMGAGAAGHVTAGGMIAGGVAGAEAEEDVGGTPLSLVELRGEGWVPVAGPAGGTGLASGPPPGWLQAPFQGMVEEKGQLYLCSVVSAPRNGRTVVVLGSRALTAEELGVLANGFGRITLTQGYSKLAMDANAEKNIDREAEDLDAGKVDAGKVAADIGDKLRGHPFDTVRGGVLAPRKHFWDPPVVFSTPITVRSWETGEGISSMMVVESRPTLLYAQLFATAAGSGVVVRVVLIVIASFFALLELFALWMAMSLSRTITRSVAELYRGTREIDAGHLEHRIPVKRKDQLAALAGSFNGMAASVSELLVQQREKDRLLSELAIAQEVQTTLFPQSPAFLPGFEVHGVCVPARTVGGDYFDFIFGIGPGLGPGGAPGGHVMLALGDISGKGISAALLMSALHSADRAFSVAWGGEDGAPPSPALLLKLVNEHLFRSTQSARYATLFLASYDAATRRLTYANGGHLPPLVISKEGAVQRLEVGGSVVGLLEGMEYEEATVQLEPGDLLVAYTDGLTEPEKAGEDFGEQRLMEYVREHREEPLTVLAGNTLKVVQAWFGEQEQPDDMTIVLARSCAESCADGGRSYADGGS
jgi:sigma-B regulation protein RsbU (phosphoserine phosphatase)